jgi:hypothetical protein
MLYGDKSLRSRRIIHPPDLLIINIFGLIALKYYGKSKGISATHKV